MKKMIILVGFMCAFNLKAETYDKALVHGYSQVPGMDFAFEIKTNTFQKVILDCQSFVTGMNFYNDNKIVHSIYLDAYGDCQNMYSFINDSLKQKKAVCLQIANSSSSMTVSNEAEDCQ